MMDEVNKKTRIEIANEAYEAFKETGEPKFILSSLFNKTEETITEQQTKKGE